MMQIREIQLNEQGKIIGLKGTFKKPFKVTTTKVYMWSFFNIDYMGG